MLYRCKNYQEELTTARNMCQHANTTPKDLSVRNKFWLIVQVMKGWIHKVQLQQDYLIGALVLIPFPPLRPMPRTVRQLMRYVTSPPSTAPPPSWSASCTCPSSSSSVSTATTRCTERDPVILECECSSRSCGHHEYCRVLFMWLSCDCHMTY